MQRLALAKAIGRRAFAARFSRREAAKRCSSYYVVLPELPQDNKDTNPLLKSEGDATPNFSISAQQCFSGLGKVALDFEAEFSNLEKQISAMKANATFDNVAVVLDRMQHDLLFAFGVAKTVQRANDDPLMRSAVAQGQRSIGRAMNAPYISPTFYKAVQTLRRDSNSLDPYQARLLDMYLLEGRLNGMELSVDEQAVFRSIMGRISDKTMVYGANVEFAVKKFWSPITDPAVLDELPLASMTAFDYDPPIEADAAIGTGDEGPTMPAKPVEDKIDRLTKRPAEHRITLSPASYHAIMSYSTDRLQRLNVWNAYVQRAGFGEPDRSNSLVIEDIRQLRKQEAELLGYPTYADMSMTTKMAGSVDNLLGVLASMVVPVKAAAQRDLSTLQKYAAAEGADYEIEMWDVAYWRRRHLESNYKRVVKSKAVQQYFSYPVVLDYLFQHVRSMFGFNIKESLSTPQRAATRGSKKTSIKTTSPKIRSWHPDAVVYDVEDASGQYVASFVIDPYARAGKASGTYIEPIRNRCDAAGSTPLAALIFDFPPPSSAKGHLSMLSFGDVQNLYRKVSVTPLICLDKFVTYETKRKIHVFRTFLVGTALQHLVTDAPYAGISGLNNVEWDIATLSSSFLGNWLTDPEFLVNMTRSVSDGKRMPIDMANELVAANQHMASLDIISQLHFSILDIALFSRREFWQELMRDVWEEVMPFKIDKHDAHACSLSLIFCGGYSAAYYSFLWSEMVAADVFQLFQEAKVSDEKFQTVGRRFASSLLARHEARSANELFRRFSGRDLSYDAFLKLNNISV